MKMYRSNFTFNRAGYMQHSTVNVLDKVVTISAGNDDSIEVYHNKESIYVLTENHMLDYIGLERFDRETLEKEFDIFIQQECEERDYLLSISRVPTKIRFLLQWDM